MPIEYDFTNALVDAYQRTGEEVGYWAHRFIHAVRRNGGLAQAKKMLKPRTRGNAPASTHYWKLAVLT